MQYRLAFCGYGEVNWCEALGTVLANDEVINGFSERGGHPVEKKKLRQWYLRITEYADRLLSGLETIQFSEAMKEMQSNWIGKSFGAEIDFKIQGTEHSLKVYTTRPDTVFGVDFMVVAPEHELIETITPASHQAEVENYIAYVKSRSERERIAEKKITGCFTGAYVINPFNQKAIPVWISEYVLAGYGTGAIMAVPCGDERDFKFAQHFNIPITNIIGDAFSGQEANPTKEAKLSNSDFLNGMIQKDAIAIVNDKIEAMGIGKRKVNYKMRDAAFSRQRYWGEPFPIKWKNGIAYPLSENELPLILPTVDHYGPGPEGEGPLANIDAWKAEHYETNTMPGYAGSSWYFLRYMDPTNANEFCGRKASDYWGQVDLYIGGTEHAVGHLLYSRMWTKALFDLGHIGFDEPYKKLLNQGMIQGSSRFVYRKRGAQVFVSAGLIGTQEVDQLHVDVNIVDGVELDTEAFKKWKPDYANASFELEDGKYICGVEVEKMSKSKFNTVNPDDLVTKYGADTFRMYEMFLGPVEQSKPWDTKGIEGVHRFIKKFWRLFYDEIKGQVWVDETPTNEEYKILHKTIKKIEEDTERYSFNTAVSAFMICINELYDIGCHKKAILEQVLILITPYAPHFAEELWTLIGNKGLIIDAPFPVFESKYVIESSKEYPVSINGKVRANISIALDATEDQVKEIVLANNTIQKWVEDKPLKKLIFVKGKMINIVV
jgi:leucyl-tRNA synthetase